MYNIGLHASLVKDYLDNERRGIADLSELSSTLWNEIKETQVIHFRGTASQCLHSVLLTGVDEAPGTNHTGDHGRGRGRGGRNGRGGRGGRGRGSNVWF